MPTELEELVEFLHHGNTQIRQIAAENLVGYSTAQPAIFKTQQLTPVKDLKLLVRDYPQIAKNAITILINISEDQEVLKALVEDEEFLKNVMKQITNPKEPHADDLSMLLANLSKSSSILKLLTLEVPIPSPLSACPLALTQLLDLFVKGATKTYNPDATFDYLSYLFADISKHPSARSFFTSLPAKPEANGATNGATDGTGAAEDTEVPLSKIQVFTQHPSVIRRLGVASTLKNLCFDVSTHPSLLALPSAPTTSQSILPFLLEPLMGTEEYTDEEQEGMFEELQLLPPDKERESDVRVLKTLLESLLLLTTTREGRDELRRRNVYPVVRETHANVEDEEVREVCNRFVQVVMRDEEGEGEDAQKKSGFVEAEEDEDEQIIEVL